MEKIVFHTNLDEYQCACWPKQIKVIPRIGETVYVVDEMREHFRNKKFPIRMHVVDVTYTEKIRDSYGDYSEKYYTLVEIELWYKPVDWEMLKLNGKYSD